jgi:hypothetical protein
MGLPADVYDAAVRQFEGYGGSRELGVAVVSVLVLSWVGRSLRWKRAGFLIILEIRVANWGIEQWRAIHLTTVVPPQLPRFIHQGQGVNGESLEASKSISLHLNLTN